MLGRLIAIGDIHGCHKEFADLLEKLDLRKDDRLILLGDLINRGPDSGNWTNQNVVFTKALGDMFPIAKLILKGALEREECRGAHYKPALAMPGIAATDLAGQYHEAQEWCDRFEQNTKRWLKSTIASHGADGDPQIVFEDVDTSLLPPRPRLYGLIGGELIEEVWKERQKKAALNGSGSAAGTAQTAAVAGPSA